MSVVHFIIGAGAASFFALLAIGTFIWQLFTIGKEIDHDHDDE